MNKYLKNLNKIEFVVTNACSGNCKHCSQGAHTNLSCGIDPKIATDAIKYVSAEYEIQTVMAFGGEPLLYPDVVYAIMDAATQMNVQKRQVITNGFFSKDENYICEVVKSLKKSGVNEILLSVDAFHQETIPIDVVKTFAKEVKKTDIPVFLQPAWLKSPTHDNPYNRQTGSILDGFKDICIPENGGNVIFFEGNAKKYLWEYFLEDIPKNPYIDNPYDVRCLSFSPDGCVLDSNVYEKNIAEIIENYIPCK